MGQGLVQGMRNLKNSHDFQGCPDTLFGPTGEQTVSCWEVGTEAVREVHWHHGEGLQGGPCGAAPHWEPVQGLCLSTSPAHG